MTLTRRSVLRIGGGLLAGLHFGADPARAAEAIEIIMSGNEDGSRVWFEPIGLLVQPGQSVRWTNRDPGNSHTATAYHPDNGDHPLRIPAGASPWNSDYLLPESSFSVTLTVPGVYDYFCVPHEHAGMVGRIVVAGSSSPVAPRPGGIPEVAEKGFPRVAAILRNGRVDAR
ncbi:plastocyanin/azurin family copper-binding protein [Faunimonas sp. B44]|uniref:plastocyanin/azurin family copper-binding protein n=1 Tax=Faunimonas sp. B44 TaxID=3461493 RepID=UPI0040450B60